MSVAPVARIASSPSKSFALTGMRIDDAAARCDATAATEAKRRSYARRLERIAPAALRAADPDLATPAGGSSVPDAP